VTLPEPDWQTLLNRALARNRRERAVQFATVDALGQPSLRTVILRGVTDTGDLYVFSDARAQKVKDLTYKPQAALCIWWRKTSEQFRFSGLVSIHKESDGYWGERRRQLWFAQSEENQALFLGPPPGTPLTDEPPAPVTSKDVSDTFVLLVLTPIRVDYLKLGRSHERLGFISTASGWHCQRLVP
jgi:pyridoxamine 5'-phosphate oxidase